MATPHPNTENNYTQGVTEFRQPDASVDWSAAEYISHEKGSNWYLSFAASVLVLTLVIYLVINDVFAAITVFLVAASIGFLSTRQPEIKNYRLSSKGLMINNRQYNLKNFKSFSIVEEGSKDSIWLKPMKRFSPFLTLYFSPENEQDIINVLSSYLPYEPRELDSLDRLARRLRL